MYSFFLQETPGVIKNLTLLQDLVFETLDDQIVYLSVHQDSTIVRRSTMNRSLTQTGNGPRDRVPLETSKINLT